MAINLTVTYNKHFEIFPLTTMVIERKNLHAHFNNPQYNESVFITIKQQPRAGRVVTKRPNGDWDFAGTFTQEQVDQGRVAYEHLRSPTSLQEFDDFVFDVESPPLKVLKRMVFNISVTIGNTDQMKRVLGFEPLIVSEGGTTSITQSNLNLSALDTYFARKIIDNWNPYLTIHISQLPIHGKLTLDGRSLYMQSNINSRDVDTGNLLYSHDHSDTLHDEIGIKIHIRSPVDTLPMLIFDNSLRIQISPINDKMFALERSSMTVVRYQTKHLSNKDLYTSDLDTPPEQIRYQIMSGPTNGKIIISNNTSSGLMFTQKDIESGNVRYINDGSNKSTKLSFQVSDGGHTPKYATFDIEVLPLKLELINHTQVSLTQTTSISRITKYHLAAIANLEQSVISYNITLRPRYGNIYINGKVVHEFDQTDINDGRVLYLQTEMSAGSDSFQVLIWIHDVVLPETKVHVVAEPLIKMHSLQAVAGAKVPITLYHLNATELSHITSTMPIYRIVRQPRLSIIKRETVDANEIFNSVEVDEFTHAELIASKIFLYVKNMRVDPDHSLTDAMHYILIASGADVQPASGILTIAIHPVDSIILNSVDNPRQLRPSNVPSNNERTSNEGNNILLSLVIAMIVTLVVTLVIILIVALFCSKFRIKLSKNDMRKEFDVISLPPPIPSESRPESFMTDYMSEFATFTDNNSPNTLTGDRQLDCHTSQSEASFPSDITRELSSRDLTVRELSPSLPQCKVTPIFTNDPSIILPRRSPSQIFQQTNPAASSSSATTGHHTNGPEEWNPYEQTNNINSPMLRKNQYWV